MLNKTFFVTLFCIFLYTLSIAQNCPGYANSSSGNAEACGNQNYVLTVPNTTCNGQIFFDVTGIYETFGGSVTWTITSVQSGGVVASGTGVASGTTNNSFGPFDPNIVGNVFELGVNDASGLGFGTTGSIEVIQGATVIASRNAAGTLLFNANITISSATITVTTPSGPVTSTANNCNDFIVLIPIQNNNFCDPLNITLPWTITCDADGSTLSSGTASVLVNPQVPSDASDIVDITWDAAACSWNVTAQNDCDLLDIGNIFTISPDPSTLNSGACGNGTENFSVDYLGASSSMNCCSTAGPLVNITYDSSTVVTTPPQVASSPFGGTNNSALVTFPPNGSGGNATSLSLCVDMNNYCFNTTGGDMSFFVFIFVDGNQIYMSPQQTGTTFNHCINLTDIPGGYTQSSDVEIYVLPNVFTSAGGTVTTFSPTGNCGSLTEGEWTADFTSTLNVTFDQMEGSAVLCTFPINAPYTCCTSPPTASNPPPITVDCATDVPAPDPAVVTGSSGTCSTPPIVTFVSDVSDGNTCQGEIITRTYHIEDACGNGVDVTQQITISAQSPTFTLSSSNPTGCGTSDGQITIENLTPSTNYNLTYTNNGNPVSSTSITTDGSGNYSIIGLGSGTYDDFTIALGNCSACSTTVNNPIQLVAGSAPTVDAGVDQTICEGASVTLTATNPDGATISWNNGVTDGVAFSPTTTTTYTVTADNGGCTSTDVVTITVNLIPTVDAGVNQAVCQGASVTLTATNPDGATISWNNGVTDGVAFSPTTTTTYTVTADNVGCTSTDAVTITVNSMPTVNAGADQTICEGASVTLTASNPDGAIISWSNGVTDGVAFNPAVGTTTYIVTADNSGCSATDSVDVSVEQTPVVNAGQDIQVCSGQQVTLSASGGNPPYQWDNGVVDGQSFTSPNGTTTYTVTSTSPSGCVGSDALTVTVGSNVQADFTASVLSGCTPLEVAFTNTSIANGNCQYIIENLATISQCNSVVTFNQAGCYDVTFILSNNTGCADTLIKSDLICVEQTPEASFEADPGTIGGMIDEVNFNNTSEGGDSFYWTFGDGQSSEDISPTHQYELDKSQFIITLIANTDLGCADTTIDVIFVKDELIFYVPNSFTPDGNNFNETFVPVFTSGFDPYAYKLLIFDRWGEIMFESNNAKVGWDGTYGGKVVPDGVYVWKIDFKRSDSDEKVSKMGQVNVLR